MDQYLPVDEKCKNISRFGTDVDENTGDDASDLEKNQQYQKQVLLKRLQYLKHLRRDITKKNPNNSFFTLFFTQLLNYYVKTTFLFYQLLNS